MGILLGTVPKIKKEQRKYHCPIATYGGNVSLKKNSVNVLTIFFEFCIKKSSKAKASKK
jgi:hypothetical protein